MSEQTFEDQFSILRVPNLSVDAFRGEMLSHFNAPGVSESVLLTVGADYVREEILGFLTAAAADPTLAENAIRMASKLGYSRKDIGL